MNDDDPSILGQFEAAGQSTPRVRLRPLEGDDEEFKAAPVGLRRSGRFEVLGHLAQGGVGDVLKGRDVDLGRDVALKVIRDRHLDDPNVIARFIEEAQIGGQLQHPGIVPVFELGLQDDDRPFFAMKLVKGDTLAALLQARVDPSKERRKFLQIFEQVAQTVAYAHARGVIHRDLKPANIMVGAFGEVQVLDWGFAKVLSRGGVADERAPVEIDVTEIATLRTEEVGSQSIAGSVMGTPAYMPPEQALGRVDELDERSDVFSLGAILCEILTGEAPYVGDDKFMQAVQARLDPAMARLDECGADRALVTLAKEALSPMRVDRPADASAIADGIHAHLASVEERAREAALKAARTRAAAEKERAAAAEQRRARKQSVFVAAAVLAALIVGGISFVWMDRGQRDAVQRARTAVGEALSDAQRQRGAGEWEAALASVDRARSLAADQNIDDELRERVAGSHARIEVEARVAAYAAQTAAQDDELLDAITEARMARFDTPDPAALDNAFSLAFSAQGISIDDGSTAAVAEAIRVRHPAILDEVFGALDAWSWLRRQRVPASDATRIASIAMKLDPDATRNEIRGALLRSETSRLKIIASGAEEFPAPTVVLLASALDERGESEAAMGLLLVAQDHFPSVLWIHAHLGARVGNIEPRRPREALRFASAAHALRPGSTAAHLRLAICFARAGRHEEALGEFAKLDARSAWRPVILEARSDSLTSLGRNDEAVREAQESLASSPGPVARRMLMNALWNRNAEGDYEQLLAEGERARSASSSPELRRWLGCSRRAIASRRCGRVKRSRARRTRWPISVGWRWPRDGTRKGCATTEAPSSTTRRWRGSSARGAPAPTRPARPFGAGNTRTPTSGCARRSAKSTSRRIAGTCSRRGCVLPTSRRSAIRTRSRSCRISTANAGRNCGGRSSRSASESRSSDRRRRP